MTATDASTYDPGYGPLVRTRVRIATWNVWGRYGPWEARLPVIIENLSAINADILALQEVWEDDERNQDPSASREQVPDAHGRILTAGLWPPGSMPHGRVDTRPI